MSIKRRASKRAAAKSRKKTPPPLPPTRTRSRIVELAPLSLRADVGEVTSEESRSVEIIWSTGEGVPRRDYETGEQYLETLSLKPEHVRLQRLNSGAPLLDGHMAFSVLETLGSVVRGTAVVNGKEGRAEVSISRRAELEGLWTDIQDGHVNGVSVGYRVYKFEETAAKGNALPVRHAVDWEPFEVSMVPLAADAGAHTREDVERNSCEISSTESEVQPMAVPKKKKKRAAAPVPEQRSEFLVEPDPLDTRDDELDDDELDDDDEPTERDLGVSAERERSLGIMRACRAARLPQSFAMDLIEDETLSLVAAQSRIFEEMGRRDPDDAPRRRGRVEFGDDPLVHVRAGIENALLHRAYPKQGSVGFELSDVGRQYRGMTLLRVAEAYLSHQGVRTSGMSKMQLAGEALGLHARSGMHTTSDFALLLADVAGKTLRAAYEAAPQTFSGFSRRVTLPDFKAVKRNQLGEAPQLLEVLEHGEFKHGTIGEGREQYQLATYGRIFGVTRKTIVNDDLDALSRVPMLFGRSARNLESDLVWAQITSNPVMGDTVALFDSAHGNLAGTPSVIDIANIGIGRAAMRNQTALDGETKLNLNPVYLLVPPAIETVADQFVSVNMLASAAGAVNPFAGKLQVVAEPRLEAADANAWFLAASPDQVDIIEYGYLEGEEGPMVESRVGFDIDGLEIKCREDFAAKVIDHRGLYKNAGA